MGLLVYCVGDYTALAGEGRRERGRARGGARGGARGKGGEDCDWLQTPTVGTINPPQLMNIFLPSPLWHSRLPLMYSTWNIHQLSRARSARVRCVVEQMGEKEEKLLKKRECDKAQAMEGGGFRRTQSNRTCIGVRFAHMAHAGCGLTSWRWQKAGGSHCITAGAP